MTKTELKSKVTHILRSTFADNPSVLRSIKQDKKWEKRLGRLINYSFETAYRRNGAYLSSNELGAALCFNPHARKSGVIDYLNQAKLAISAIGLARVPGMLKREAYIKKQHPAGNYLHFWFIGVLPQGRNMFGAFRELKEIITKVAKEEKMDVYIETSVERNVKFYKLLGLELYHTWDEEGKSPTLYFLKGSVK